MVRAEPHVLALGRVGAPDAQRGAVRVVVHVRGAKAQRDLDALRGASSGNARVPAAASGRGDLTEGAGRDEVARPDEVEGVPYVLGCFEVRREKEKERDGERERVSCVVVGFGFRIAELRIRPFLEQIKPFAYRSLVRA